MNRKEKIQCIVILSFTLSILLFAILYCNLDRSLDDKIDDYIVETDPIIKPVGVIRNMEINIIESSTASETTTISTIETEFESVIEEAFEVNENEWIADDIYYSDGFYNVEDNYEEAIEEYYFEPEAELTDAQDYSFDDIDITDSDDYGDVEPIEEDGWNYIYEPNQWNSTYMGVHKITSISSPQYQWLQSHDWGYTDEGICCYDGRILVALTPAFGTIGDYVDLLLEDGSILQVIICDEKANSDTYGHWGTGGLNVIELIVSPDWYNGHENKYYPKVVAFR